jgi:hypothetical protein
MSEDSTPDRGSILVRRGPTADRQAFTPLNGEVIYDTENDQLYIGDGVTSGGKPAFGDKIKVDVVGNVTEIMMRGEQDRPSPTDGLFRYNPNTQSLEYSDGEDYYLVASTPFQTSTNVLFVSPNGKDDNTYGEKRGRTPGTAFASLNAACREAERVVNRASKGLGPYQKFITYDSQVSQKKSTIIAIADQGDFKVLNVGKGASFLDAQTELRSGFRILGMTSGATAIIEEYNIQSTENYDEFIVNVEDGTFVQGEELKFGNPIPGVPYSAFKAAGTSYPEITIRVESGIYFEHFPMKVPNNTSIKGDEFRRSIIRPRPGPSASPYANIRFKRDAVNLGLDPAVVGNLPFGAHYLADRNNHIYNYAENVGDYDEAYKTLSTASTKKQLADSTINFITTTYPSLVYDVAKCRRDVGYIIDAAALDMLYGGFNETLFAALTYQGQLPGDQVTETAAAIDHLKTQTSMLLESAEQSVVEDLIGSVAEIIRGNFNAPKDNDEMDVLLMNDATIIRNISVQGHGGFMEVLDPEGQILTKSPYTQTASSFSKSKAPDVSFAGGMFIDGFAGNLDARIKQINSPTEIVIDNVFRQPQTPTSFFIDGTRFQIDKADTVGVGAGEYRLILNDNTPWTLAYYQIVNETAVALPTVPYNIEILTAGNISMLGNDFTQINDLGYGVYTTNNARSELVSVFCYYNHISYLAENGSDIRSLNGSTAYGDFALVAKGSDPLEVSDQVFVDQDTIQIGTAFTTSDYPNEQNDTVLYVTNLDYEPFNVSEVEIDHNGGTDLENEPVFLNRYEVTSVTAVDGTSPQVYQLNIAVGIASKPGIQVDVPNATNVIIRNGQVVKYNGIVDVNPTRPSTALVYDDDPDKVYRVLAYDVAGLPVNEARITLRETYDYVKLVLDETAGAVAGSGQVGDTTIRLDVDFDVNEKSRIDTANSAGTGYIFAFNDTVHEITAYRDKATTGQLYAEVDFTPALTKSFGSYSDKPTMRAGVQAGHVARITVGISTLRCTGHDLLDIGTGSYQTSSYPREIYGQPEIAASQPKEVVEEGKGRVFYVTTDQDGNFRVGDYFKVDQGTGTVTFSASIALSNLDGIGFKRGVAVSEFSTDDAMTDNASDTVPTESAVRSYVNRRLGLTHANVIQPGKIGPGYLDLTATQALQGNLDLANFKVERIATPTVSTDAANKDFVETYANSKTFEVNSKSANVDNSIVLNTDDVQEVTSPLSPTNLYFTNARARGAISATDLGGDGSLTYDNTTGVISYTGPSASEVRAHFSAAQTGGDGVTRYGGLEYDTNNGTYTYTGISLDEIRSAFTVTGSITYNAATGEIEFDEKTDGDIRGLFSASGDLNYNVNTGVFSVTKFTTSNARASITSANTPDGAGEVYYGSLAYNNSTGAMTLTGASRTQVRSALSVSGDLSYNAATGELTYNERTDNTIRGLFSASGDVTYDDSTGEFSFTQSAIGSGDVRSNVSASDAGGLGSFSYTENTGVFEYTGPSNADIRGLLSATGDITYNSATGQFSFTDTDRSDADIRGLFNASGDLTYDALTGNFSFSEGAQRTDAQIRNLFSGGGDLSYSSITGGFSVTKTKVGITGSEASGTITIADGGSVTATQIGNTVTLTGVDTTYALTVNNATGDTAADQTRVRLSDGATNQDVLFAGSAAINVAGANNKITVTHADTSNNQESVSNSANDTVIQSISVDDFGHITDISSKTLSIEDLGTLADLGYSGTNDADTYTSWGIKANSGEATAITSGTNINFVGSGATTITPSSGPTVTISSTDTIIDVDDTPVDGATTSAISSNWAFDNVKTAVPANALFTDTNTFRAISSTPTDGATTTSISSDWAFDNVKTAVPTGALFTDTNTDTTYSTATSSTLGLVKIGATPSVAKTYAVQLDSNDKMFVSVPWDTNTNTVTSVGISGSETTGTVTIAGAGNVTATQVGSTITLTGSASATDVAVTNTSSDASEWNVAFVANDGAQSINIDKHSSGTGGLSYIPSSSTLRATTFAGNSNTANYADLAEVYTSDADYEPGTVVAFGGEQEVTISTGFANTRVAGVISEFPAYCMNSNEDGAVVALQGRVPVKVLGKVQKGDMMVTCGTKPGYAMVARYFIGGAVIGKALEDKDTAGEGVIEVVVGRM